MRVNYKIKPKKEYLFYKSTYCDLIVKWQNNFDPRKLFINNLSFKNKKILDIGCANGLLVKKYIKNNQLYGIDISEKLISSAKKNGFVFAKTLNIDKEKLPFEKDFFDVIFFFDVIEHVFKPEKLIKESFKVLKKDGLFYITTHNLFRCRNTSKISDPNLFSIKEIKGLLKKEVFRIVSVNGWSWYRKENETIFKKAKYFFWWHFPIFAKDMFIIVRK